MPSAASLRLPTNALTYFVSFAFTMAALTKLHPSHPMYSEMVLKSSSWRSVLQMHFLTDDQLRIGIGVSEIFFGLLLIAVPVAAYGLIIIMVGAIFTHYKLDGAITKEAAPAIVLLVCIVLRNVLYGMMKDAERAEEDRAQQAEGKDE